MNKGEITRREVMGDDFVDHSLNNSNSFTEDLQGYINEHAWGSVWQRNTISRKTRSLITLSALVALRAPNELKNHVRGAVNNGCTVLEIKETLLHNAVYCGVPATQEAFRAAAEVLLEMGMIEPSISL